MADGGASGLSECAICGVAITPRDRRQRTCGGSRCMSAASRAARLERDREGYLQAVRTRSAVAYARSNAYRSARHALRRAGRLTPEIEARIDVLRGLGRLGVPEGAPDGELVRAALAHCELLEIYRDDVRARSEQAKRSGASDWYERNAGYHVARAILGRHGLITPEVRASLAALREQGRLGLPADAPAGALAREALTRAGLLSLVSERALDAVSVPSAPAIDPWVVPSPDVSGPIAQAVELRLWRGETQVHRITDHYGARMLHGAIHRALGIGHGRDRAAFALVLPDLPSRRPERRGLWLLPFVEGVADRLPASVVFGGDTSAHRLTTGLRVALRAPRAREPGQYRARLSTITPIAIRQGRTNAERAAGQRTTRLREDITDLAGSLEQVAQRLGISVRHDAVVARVIQSDTELALDHDGERGVLLGGHWRLGDQRGRCDAHIGVIDLECNAVGRWLLDCAALIGIGSRLSLGLGRVRVEDL